jgi:stage III sporulation protein AH
MTMGKRQLVLAALVVALGAAVYLNWMFNNNSLVATDAATSVSDREYGQAQLADTPAVSGTKKSASSVSSSVKANAPVNTYFSEANITRQRARDTATELLMKTLNDAKSSDAAKKEVAQQSAVIAKNIIQENSIEALIKAKGFSNCIVFIQNSECSVVVGSDNLSQDNAVVIKDIVAGQAGISYDKIKIISKK